MCAGPQRSRARLHACQKYDLGLAELERALQINPSDAEALLARAAALLWTGQVDHSIATGEPAARINPNLGPEPPLNLGIGYLLSRRYADAVKLLEAARARYPAYPLSIFRWPAPTPSWAARRCGEDALEQG